MKRSCESPGRRSRKQRPKIDLAAFDTFEDTLMQAECLLTEMVMRVVVIYTCLNLHFLTIYEFDLSGSVISFCCVFVYI